MIDHDRLARAFAAVDTTAIADCDKSIRTMTSAIGLRSASPRAHGPAFTVRVHGDFFGVARAIESAPRGSVIVVDGAGHELALCGELFTRTALARGLAAIIVDAGVRDVGYLRTCPLPVYSRHVTPMAGTTRSLGDLQVPVTCGGVAVSPGDIVLADAEGILVLDPGEALHLVETASSVKATEARAIAVLDAGGTLGDVLNLTEHETALVAGDPSTLSFLV